MANPWITHVKAVQRDENISYSEALKIASLTYKRKTPKRKTAKRTKRMKGKGVVDEAKKFYTRHKKKIHTAGAIAGGIGLAGLSGLASVHGVNSYRRHRNYPGRVFSNIDRSALDDMWAY